MKNIEGAVPAATDKTDDPMSESIQKIQTATTAGFDLLNLNPVVHDPLTTENTPSSSADLHMPQGDAGLVCTLEHHNDSNLGDGVKTEFFDDFPAFIKNKLGNDPVFLAAAKLSGETTMGSSNSAGHYSRTDDIILMGKKRSPSGLLVALVDDDILTLRRFILTLSMPFNVWKFWQAAPKSELAAGESHHPQLSGRVKIPEKLESDADLIAVAESVEELYLIGKTMDRHGELDGTQDVENWRHAALYSLWVLDIWRSFTAVKASHLAKIQSADPEPMATFIPVKLSGTSWK